MVARGEFLEYAQVFGKYSYGTPKKWLEESRRQGLDLVLEIDVQGAAAGEGKVAGIGGDLYTATLAARLGTPAAQPRAGCR